MAKKTHIVTTTIPEELYHEIKSKDIKWTTLIRLGYQSWVGNPQLITRIEEVEKELQKIQEKMKTLAIARNDTILEFNNIKKELEAIKNGGLGQNQKEQGRMGDPYGPNI